MNSAERRLLEALRALNASQPGAPAGMEITLRGAFRERHRRRWRYLVPAAFAAAAALTVFLRPADLPVPPQAPRVVAPPAFAYTVPVRPDRPEPRLERRRSPQVLAAARTRPPIQTEEFVPFFPGSSLLPLERAQVLRIAIPRSALAPAGFTVDPVRLDERVPADVLMGEDGLIRGIRLVRY